jgi:GNAT superfamily N-acetyltransferase
MGMVEDLFTLPDFRKRGIATAIIARAIAHVRSQDAKQILIGALAYEPPKRLIVSTRRIFIAARGESSWQRLGCIIYVTVRATPSLGLRE